MKDVFDFLKKCPMPTFRVLVAAFLYMIWHDGKEFRETFWTQMRSVRESVQVINQKFAGFDEWKRATDKDIGNHEIRLREQEYEMRRRSRRDAEKDASNPTAATQPQKGNI